MSTTITETYHTQVVRETQTAVHASLSTDAKKEAAANSLSASLNSGEVKKRAYEDVKELAQTVREIRRLFSTINVTLVHFDNEKFKDKDGKELRLSPEWKKQMNSFEMVMQASYENATSAVDVMKEITAILGADITTTEVTYEDLKAEVDSFIEKVKEKKKDASKTKDMFQSLADDVRLFSGRIDVVLQTANEGLKVELASARQRVEVLAKSLKKLDDEIISLAVGLASAVAVGAAAGFTALCTLSPFAAAAAIASVATSTILTRNLVKKNKERKEMGAVKATADADVGVILGRQPLLKKYVEKFELTKEQVEQVAKQIDTITNIWQTIDLDMLSIMESLEKNVSKRAPITGFFWKKMGPTRETYKRLTECLETYVEQSRSIYG